MKMERLLVAFLLVFTIACDDEPGSNMVDLAMHAADDMPLALDLSSDQSPDLDAVCDVPDVADYCAGKTCRTYNDELANQMSRATMPNCFLARTGTCGNLSYIEQSLASFDNTIFYYDNTGVLVAVTVQSDTNEFCGNTSFSIHYGLEISCTPVETQLICQCLAAGADGGLPCN